MDEKIISRVAYCMQTAYHDTRTRKEACEYVSARYPDVERIILLAMWEAIDAGDHFMPATFYDED